MNDACLTHCMQGAEYNLKELLFSFYPVVLGMTSGGQARQRLSSPKSAHRPTSLVPDIAARLLTQALETSLIVNTGWLQAGFLPVHLLSVTATNN